MPEPSPEASPAPPGDDLTGTTVGRFVIRARLGAGGMGEVYLAEDPVLKRMVAVKRLSPHLGADPAFRQRFLREAENASALTHQNIAGIYDVIEKGSELFLVMEYVEGTTLRLHLREQRDLGEFVRIAAQCAEALAEAHGKGVIHRDIKPENIMFTSGRQVKVLDFGVARRRLPSSDDVVTQSVDTTTSTGFTGTPAYMAPEVLLEKTSDHRADIFSLGVVFYEMLAGEHPFKAGSFVATAERILRETPAPLGQVNTRVPAELERIVHKMLAKDPGERYSSAEDLAVDLRALGRTPTQLRVTLTLPQRARARPFNWRTASGRLQLAAGVLAVAALGYWAWSATRPPGLARRDTILLGHFANLTQEPSLEAILQEALRIEMEQSPYLRLMPRARVEEALARMKMPEDTVLDERVGGEICVREGAQALLLSSVSELGGRYAVSMRVVQPPSGQVLAGEQEASLALAETPEATRRLARRIRQQLGETLGSVQMTSTPPAPVTTASLEALLQFTLGRQRLDQAHPQEALPFFLQAIERDPDFAMAHEFAAITYQRLGDYEKLVQHLKRAAQLADRLGPRERYKILGDYDAYYERFDRAISSYQALLNLYPDDSRAHATLGHFYNDVMDFEPAIAETEIALQLSPGPLARGLLAEFYFKTGQTERAIALEQENLKQEPQRQPSWIRLASYELARGKLAECERALRQAEELGAARGPWAADLLMTRADFLLAQGRYGEALAALEEASGGEKLDAAGVRRQLLRARTLIELGRRGEAANLLASLPDLPERPDLWLRKGVLSAHAGNLATAEGALRLLEESAATRQSPLPAARVQILRAEIALARHRVGDAERAATAAGQAYLSTLVLETEARVQAAAGNHAAAIESYRAVLRRSGERILEIDYPAVARIAWIHYELGRLLHDTEKAAEARKHLEEFLKRWARADANLAQVQDALRRLGGF